ncbi:acyl-CoA dehydrogenase family protein [Nocardia sp. NPDC051321]|uniref:acyl-CoA dehydrogenase family protein n=1 Tax=Nocardia sp. NPDC051321 TaxID=3364323 RepID=UPI00378913F0
MADFRVRARDWLADNARPRIGTGEVDLPAARRFQRAACTAGFAGISWPREYGGSGLTADHQRAFEEEALGFDLPTEPFTVGLSMVGPTLLDVGSEAQRRRYLPALLRGEEIWCQLLSEPEAGSDLAGLRCRASGVDGGFRVTGHKIWVSRAQWADFGVLLAITDADRPRHRNLGLLIVDMRAPGVTVRPLRDLAGRTTFNEVVLDRVWVPGDRVVGGPHAGWTVTMAMLQHERAAGALGLRAGDRSMWFADLAAAAHCRGVADSPVIRERLATVYLHERALGLYRARLAQRAQSGDDPGARSSVAKLAWSLMDLLAADTAAEVVGSDAVWWRPDRADGDRWARFLCTALSTGIAGGTDEIQRTVIAERLLGLPREPSH